LRPLEIETKQTGYSLQPKVCTNILWE